MDYKDKYLKYKMKYLNLTHNSFGGVKRDASGNIIKKNILLMFLGGTPNQDNIIKHYKQMNVKFDNKDNFYVVIHPMSLESFIINPDFADIFNPNNIFVVDKDHHLKTGWGTRSLSDATLLMMQYAHFMFSNQLFDKYILLSSSCCPLYTFDEIYRVLLRDEKSWLNGSIINHTDMSDADKFLTDHNYSFSQWMILDKKHAMYFFIDNNDELHLTDMYIKSDVEHKCIRKREYITNNIVINSKYINKNLIRLLGVFQPCSSSDELFFGKFIMFNLYLENLKNKITFDNKDFINIFQENLTHITLENILIKLKKIPFDLLHEINAVNTKNISTVHYLYPITYVNAYGHYDLMSFKISDGIRYINIKNINVDFYEFYLKRIDRKRIQNLLLSQSTYCNWFEYNVDPFNFLRNFPLDNLNDYINNIDFTDINKKLTDMFKRSCIEFKFERNLFYNSVIDVVSHPVEYTCWTFANMLNVYLLTVYFICSIRPPDTFDQRRRMTFITIFNAYQELIFKELKLDIRLKLLIDTFDLIIIGDKDSLYTDYIKLYEERVLPLFNAIQKAIKLNYDILNKVYGNPITPNVLLAALSQGSLFIRKCYNTSMIESYSDVLKKCVYEMEKNTDTEKLNVCSVNKDKEYKLHSYSGYSD
jgi:hypothetical protein